jgi:TatA/E family protein of Tat protein translocase
MFGLGFGELVVIFLIALIFIGPKKLPELAKGLGKGIREFQDAAKGLGDQLQNAGDSEANKIADATQQEAKTEKPADSENKDTTQS